MTKIIIIAKPFSFTTDKRNLVLFLILQLAIAAFAQDKAIAVFEGQTVAVNNGALRSKFRQCTAFKLESKKLFQFVHQSAVSSFRLSLGSDKQWDIDLEPSNISTSDYHLKLLTPEGVQTISSHPNFLFKGKVKGSGKNEQVRLSIKEGFIYGSIQSEGKEYFIEPIDRFTSAKEKDQYIIYEAKDVINSESFSCGVQNKEFSLKEVEKQKDLREQSPQSIICKKVKFISVADYSMYQRFGSDVHEVETGLLSILNLAEGNYTTLNFRADGSTDVGTDKLQFEMEEIIVSTCKECDMVSAKNEVGILLPNFSDWVSANQTNTGSKMFQLWTTREIYTSTKPLAGYEDGSLDCTHKAVSILRYSSDDPGYLRVAAAHETGHAFGCAHDDDIKSNVTGFIMYSAANASCTRFSTLADFGGINYSSQQTIRNRIINSSCLEDCTGSNCEDVKDLKLTLNSSDSIQFTWNGSGNFLCRYKVADSLDYDASSIKQITGNSITLKDLQSCTLYQFSVQKVCSTGLMGKTSSVIFNPSPLNVKLTTGVVHGNLYDLHLDLNCSNCSAKEYVIKIDKTPYPVPNNRSLKTIMLKNLFADGARHRIEISKDTSQKGCAFSSFFTAPYYRSSSKKLLMSDFNDCTITTDWKDSVVKQHPSYPSPYWYVDKKNFYTNRTESGSLDSTCMVYYNSHSNAYRGTLALISPVIGLTGYNNIYLHFDFNFLSYKAFSGQDFGSFWVEAYNGSSWTKVFEYTHNDPAPRSLSQIKNIWDSLPQRVFVNLDSFKNKNFQIRFIVDDGLVRYGYSGQVFAAFDNIQVDGYEKALMKANDIIVYPNPAKGEVFIQFTQQPVTDINYRIIDVSGRVVDKGILNNYRINMNRMSTGMYFLILYSNGEIIAKKKVIKQ